MASPAQDIGPTQHENATAEHIGHIPGPEGRRVKDIPGEEDVIQHYEAEGKDKPTSHFPHPLDGEVDAL